MAEQPIPGPEHRRLELFVGNWDTEGTIKVNPSGPGVKFQAVDSYEWVPGGFFLLHRWDAHMPDGRTQGIEVIGYDSAKGTYTVRSFDSAGNTDIMTGSVASDTWTFEGKSLRFRGGFRDGGNTLAGIWEQRSDDGAPWVYLMDVKLSKISGQRSA
jgi:Protein of unknown function (DUF1579)